MTHRFSLADEELVELLQQGRFPNNLPAHVGVPGLLIGIPGGGRERFEVHFYSKFLKEIMKSYHLRG